MGLEKLGCKPLTVRGGVFRDTKALPEGLGGEWAAGRAMVTPFTGIRIAAAASHTAHRDFLYHIFTSWFSQRTKDHGREISANPL